MNKLLRKFTHNILRWGYPTKEFKVGFNNVSLCEECNEELAQDSTGAWFHLSDY